MQRIRMRTAAPLRSASWLLTGLACWLATGCSAEREYPSRPITLICPWGAGGGTDAVSRQMAAHLEQELGVPVSVVNATGGKGVTGHSRGRAARPDGYTLLMGTFELNTMHWSGLTDLTHEDFTPLVSVNEDYAALFVRSDAPWQSLPELEAAIREQPGELTASGTASGGAWHLALAGWLLSAGLDVQDVTWVSSTGAGPSLQELLSGGVDMVCCSLPEAATQLKNGDVRALGVMAPARVADFPDVPTFIEQGRDWTLGGWRGLMAPKETPPEIVDALTDAILKIVRGETTVRVSRRGTVHVEQTFPEFMQQQGYDHTWRGPEEFRAFLIENDEKFGELLSNDAMQSVNEDRFNPLAFPAALAALIGLVLLALWAGNVRAGRGAPDGSTPGDDSVRPADHRSVASAPRDAGFSKRGMMRFALIILAIALYPLFGETVGFLIYAFAVTLTLLWWLGTRLWVSTVICVVLAPAIYQVFHGLLRVPLPQGWWGW